MTILKSTVRVLALIGLAHVAGCSKPPITAQQLAAEANKRASLPMDLGDGYRLDAITAEGNAVVSTVTMTDDALAADPRFRDVMHTATMSDICREIAPAKQLYAEMGLSVAKVYKDSKGSEILRVDVRPADCG